MPNSRKRQREREKPLKELKYVISKDIEIVNEVSGLGASFDLMKQVGAEIFAFSDPWCRGFLDAPLPSHREDLRQEYAAKRLSGDVDESGVMELARALMPTPDQKSQFALGNIGHPQAPPYAETHRAFKSVNRRMGRL